MTVDDKTIHFVSLPCPNVKIYVSYVFLNISGNIKENNSVDFLKCVNVKLSEIRKRNQMEKCTLSFILTLILRCMYRNGNQKVYLGNGAKGT